MSMSPAEACPVECLKIKIQDSRFKIQDSRDSRVERLKMNHLERITFRLRGEFVFETLFQKGYTRPNDSRFKIQDLNSLTSFLMSELNLRGLLPTHASSFLRLSSVLTSSSFIPTVAICSSEFRKFRNILCASLGFNVNARKQGNRPNDSRFKIQDSRSTSMPVNRAIEI